jgi:ABC-type amino acid transport substrate-binding protein
MLTALSFLLAVSRAGAGAEVVRMAVFQLEPFMMEMPGTTEPGGVTIDYWRNYVAPKLGITLVVWGPYPIARAQKMLEAGEVDVVSQLTKTHEREALFLYPDTPLAVITSCLVVLKDDPLKEYSGALDIYGKKIGFIENAYIPPPFVDPRVDLELIPFADHREINLRKLVAGRIDALLDINLESMEYYLRSSKYRDIVRILPLPFEKTAVYSVFSNTNRGRMLRDEFEKVNAEGYKSGVYRAIYGGYVK